MNPIKNRKNLEATIDDIRNFAYAYLEKYNPSKLHQLIIPETRKGPPDPNEE